MKKLTDTEAIIMGFDRAEAAVRRYAKKDLNSRKDYDKERDYAINLRRFARMTQ